MPECAAPGCTRLLLTKRFSIRDFHALNADSAFTPEEFLSELRAMWHGGAYHGSSLCLPSLLLRRGDATPVVLSCG